MFRGIAVLVSVIVFMHSGLPPLLTTAVTVAFA